MPSSDSWPGGRTWVFQGTILEDATAGTHVVSATIQPGVGNEIRVLYGHIVVGNTATSQTALMLVDDAANTVAHLWSATGTTANLDYDIGQGANAVQNTSVHLIGEIIVSGNMRLILQVTTTAVSVTQTFAVVCRIWGDPPTVTLNDTVGTPTPTTNTNAVM